MDDIAFTPIKISSRPTTSRVIQSCAHSSAQDGPTFVLNSRRNSSICSRAVIKSARSTAVSLAVNPIGVFHGPERYGGKLKTADDVKELMKLLGGQPYLIRRALYALATDAGLSLAKLIEIAPSESGLFGDHLRRYNWLLQESRELKEALRQILRDNRCDDERLFQRLRAAGLIRGETRHSARMRCELYAGYFKQH